MLTIAKTAMRGTPCFAIESVAEPLVFVEKIRAEHVISIKNRRGRRPFQSKTERPDDMALSVPSQSRDLANPLGSEASILRFIIS